MSASAEKLMSDAASTGSHARSMIASDGTQLAVSLWLAKSPMATLFYIHGIQSHSGWLYETGPYLSSKGINVIALDRRGSGRSGGIRGHADTADQILRDYRQALDYAASLSEDLPFIVLGQSFGGSVLAAMLCRYGVISDAVIFSAPALGQQRFRYDAHTLNQKRAKKGEHHFPIGLRDAEYSSEDKYLRFIANDALLNRSITTSMASCQVELEDIYLDNTLCLEAIGVPVHFIEPHFDSIINTGVSRNVLSRYVPLITHTIDTHSHYMEFSNKRYQLWTTIANICATTEQRHA